MDAINSGNYGNSMAIIYLISVSGIIKIPYYSAIRLGYYGGGKSDVTQSGINALKGFVKGIKQDLVAVINALSLPWSNGQTEGQVNRLKLIKRQMYGRANFDLLRKRVIGNPLRC